jgi:NTE family protein
VLAGRAEQWHKAVRDIEHVWANFRVGQAHRVGRRDMPRRCALDDVIAQRWSGQGSALVVRQPAFARLMRASVPFEGIARNIAAGNVHALGLSATSYETGRSNVFYEARATQRDWTRPHHSGYRTTLALPHLMASMAVPLLFPAEPIGNEYFGDGAMRQLAPVTGSATGRHAAAGDRNAQRTPCRRGLAPARHGGTAERRPAVWLHARQPVRGPDPCGP